jgi:hypothetical protein
MFSSLTLSPDGSLHLVWEDRLGNTSRILYAMGVPMGWSHPVVLSGADCSATAPTIDAGTGGVYAAWTEERRAEKQVAFRELSNGVWLSPVRISGETHKAIRPRVAVGRGGLVGVVWEDHRLGIPSVYYRERVGGEWLDEMPITDGASKAFRPVLAHGPGALVFVAWYGGIGEASSAVYRRREEGRWGPPVVLAEHEDPIYFVSIAVDDNGRLHAVYQNRRGGRYNVFYRMSE